MNKPEMTAGLLAALGLAALAPARAAAESVPGPYIAFGAVYDDMPDRDLVISGFKVDSQWKKGWGGVAALGYRFSPNLRAEVEASGRVAKVTTFNGVAPWAGKQWDNSIMLNGFYDLDLGGPVTPYVGVGVGMTQLIWGNNFRVPTQAAPTIYDNEGIRMGWQGIVGVSYAVTPKISVALDGRLKGAFGGYSFPGSVVGRNITDFHYKTRSVVASVRYSLGSDQAAASTPVHDAAESVLGPYVAFGGGYDNMPDRNLMIVGREVSSQWKTGWGGFAALGYRFSPHLRAEVELSGRVSKVTTFNDVAPWAGKQWDNSVMLNGFYDFDLGGPIHPYVGAGIGGTQLLWGNNFRVPTQAAPTIYDNEGIRMGWQGIVGVSYDVTPKISVALDGRLKGAFGGYSFPGSVAGRNITDFHYKTRSVFASVRYSFGSSRH